LATAPLNHSRCLQSLHSIPKNKKPTNQCFWRVGLGNLKLDQDLSPKSPIARLVRHTTCATSAWTTPHLATIRHANDTLPDFAPAVNRKSLRRRPQKPIGSCTRFIPHLIRSQRDNESTPAQSNTRSQPGRVSPTFARGIFQQQAPSHRAKSDTRGRRKRKVVT